MKISKLISKLEKLKEKHGDLPILVEESGMGGHAMHTVSDNLELSTMSLSTLLTCDEPEEAAIKEMFPEWDGDLESKQNLKTKYVEIALETMLYAT